MEEFFHRWPEPIANIFIGIWHHWEWLLVLAIIVIVIANMYGKSRGKDKSKPWVIRITYAIATLIVLAIFTWTPSSSGMHAPAVKAAQTFNYGLWIWRLVWLAVISGLVAFLIKRPLNSTFIDDRRDRFVDAGTPLRKIPKKHLPSVVSLIGLALVLLINIWAAGWLFQFDQWLLVKLSALAILYVGLWLLGGVIILDIQEIAVVTRFKEPNRKPWVWRHSADPLEQHTDFGDQVAQINDRVSFLRTGLNISFKPFWLPFHWVGLILLLRRIGEDTGQTRLIPTKPVMQADDVTVQRLMGVEVSWNFQVFVLWNADPFIYLEQLGPDEQVQVRRTMLEATENALAKAFSGMNVEQILHWRTQKAKVRLRSGENGQPTDWDNFLDELAHDHGDRFGLILAALTVGDMELPKEVQDAINREAAAGREVGIQKLTGEAAAERMKAEFRGTAKTLGVDPDNMTVDERLLVQAYILRRDEVARSNILVSPESNTRVPTVIALPSSPRNVKD